MNGVATAVTVESVDVAGAVTMTVESVEVGASCLFSKPKTLTGVSGATGWVVVSVETGCGAVMVETGRVAVSVGSAWVLMSVAPGCCRFSSPTLIMRTGG
jgi:hypothetical protein